MYETLRLRGKSTRAFTLCQMLGCSALSEVVLNQLQPWIRLWQTGLNAQTEFEVVIHFNLIQINVPMPQGV